MPPPNARILLFAAAIVGLLVLTWSVALIPFWLAAFALFVAGAAAGGLGWLGRGDSPLASRVATGLISAFFVGLIGLVLMGATILGVDALGFRG